MAAEYSVRNPEEFNRLGKDLRQVVDDLGPLVDQATEIGQKALRLVHGEADAYTRQASDGSRDEIEFYEEFLEKPPKDAATLIKVLKELEDILSTEGFDELIAIPAGGSQLPTSKGVEVEA